VLRKDNGRKKSQQMHLARPGKSQRKKNKKGWQAIWQRESQNRGGGPKKKEKSARPGRFRCGGGKNGDQGRRRQGGRSEGEGIQEKTGKKKKRRDEKGKMTKRGGKKRP